MVFNFYTTCVEVAFSLLCKLRRSDFNFCPTWTEVGFLLPTNLIGSPFFIPDKLSGSWF